MNFVYIYAEMKGSAHDIRVLEFAKKQDNFDAFISLNGYFLADADYSLSSLLVLILYSSV